MGKIGWGEFLVIAILALVVFGPDRLPKVGRALGQAIRSVKKYVHEATRELEDVEELKDIKKDVEDIRKDVRDMGRNLERSVSGDMAAAAAGPAAPEAAKETENAGNAEKPAEDAGPITQEEI